MTNQSAEKAAILEVIEAHLSAGLGCRCSGWKIDTSQRPIDPRAQHRAHVAEVLAERFTERKPDVTRCPDELDDKGYVPIRPAERCPTCINAEGYDRLSGPCPTCHGEGVYRPASTERES